MLRLLLDGKPVIIKDGSQFKLSRENPLYTEGGDYTLEVTLPLDGCAQNLRVFGPLHRMEVGKDAASRHEYAFSMLADDVNIEGTAVLISVTHEEVRLQLLAGQSELNFRMTDADGKDLYVDELELGMAWETEYRSWPFASLWGEQTPQNTAMWLLYSGSRFVTLTSGSSSETDWLALPIWSEADGAEANGHQQIGWDRHGGGQSECWFFALKDKDHGMMPLDELDISFSRGMELDAGFVLAPQPYLCYVVERVISALGYTLNRSDNVMRQGWMSEIFVANSRSTVHLSRMLPHWTVREFLRQVQQFYGVSIRYAGGRMRVVPRTQDYAGEISLHEVADEYQVEVDDEEQVRGMSNVNVGFAYPDASPYAILPETVWEHARVVDRATFDAATDDERKRMLVLPSGEYLTDGLRAWLTVPGTTEKVLEIVDCNAPHLLDESRRQADLELRIVPVRTENWMGKDAARWYGEKSSLYYGLKSKGKLSNYRQMVTSDTRECSGYDDYGIEDYLQDAVEEPSKRDVMEVALRGSMSALTPAFFRYDADGQVHSLYVPMVEGAPYVVNHEGGGVYGMDSRFCISCHGAPQYANSFVQTVLLRTPLLQSRARWCFSFLDNVRLDVEACFLIGGRRYACEKIEYEIGNDGVSPLKKGYFFELG